MSDARYIVGDVFDVLRTLPDNSVDLVFTSPPFLALRSYLPADHPDKSKEIGSEPTPADFIDTLLDVTEECARVLAPHGSLCFELGDTYAGSGGAGGDYADGGMRANQPKFRQGTPRWDGRPEGQVRTTTSDPVECQPLAHPGAMPEAKRWGVNERDGFLPRPGWPSAKSLCLIPESYRWALAYGRNPFNGRQTEPWRVRNVVRWCRPNPPVGALGDKFRPGTSDVVVACKSRTRYFDLDAVRASEPPANTHPRTARGVASRPNDLKASPDGNRSTLPIQHLETNGAPPLDHWWDTFDEDAWLISTAPYKGAHYATFPPALVVKPVLAMCPQRVCRVCGEPSRRMVERKSLGFGFRKSGENRQDQPKSTESPDCATRATLGWTDCGHGGDYRNGVVLDPFAGSGTTLEVATGHGRDAIGIDLDARNAELAQQRVGMFLAVG